MTQVTVVSGFDDAMAEVGFWVQGGVRAYARRMGYGYHLKRDYVGDTHPSWQKVREVVRFLKLGHSVLWVDADSVITNGLVDLVPLMRPGLNVSQDWGDNGSPFSLGNFFATPESLPVWEKVLAKESSWANRPLWEQSAAQELWNSGDAEARSLIHVHPRRLLNAVPREWHGGAPEPWQPGDFLCHLTSMPNHDRANFGYQRHYWHARSLIGEWDDDVGWSMDARHVAWLRDAVSFLKPSVTLEVGVWDGASSLATLLPWRAGRVNQVHYCDLSWRQKFLDRTADVPRQWLHQANGVSVMRSVPADVVIVDADHRMPATGFDVDAILRLPKLPRLLAFHDVCAAAAGYPGCEGPSYAWQAVESSGLYKCLVDARVRHGELTHRGLLLAALDDQAYLAVREAYYKNIW